MNLVQALLPFRGGADSLICFWVEVSVTSILIAPKDNAGSLSIRAFVQKSILRRECETAKTEFAPQTYSLRDI